MFARGAACTPEAESIGRDRPRAAAPPAETAGRDDPELRAAAIESNSGPAPTVLRADGERHRRFDRYVHASTNQNRGGSE